MVPRIGAMPRQKKTRVSTATYKFNVVVRISGTAPKPTSKRVHEWLYQRLGSGPTPCRLVEMVKTRDGWKVGRANSMAICATRSGD
jgi:hypothetical protein